MTASEIEAFYKVPGGKHLPKMGKQTTDGTLGEIVDDTNTRSLGKLCAARGITRLDGAIITNAADATLYSYIETSGKKHWVEYCAENKIGNIADHPGGIPVNDGSKHYVMTEAV